MAKRKLIIKLSFLLLIAASLLLLLSIMFQCKVATSSRFSWSTGDPGSQLMKLTRTRKLLDLQDYSGYVPNPSDYDYNDFYRRQGDVPSPGIGH
ncbi:hypothetical protein DITRI_Ditri20bG0118500 [Diplodiscus trichospermus]